MEYVGENIDADALWQKKLASLEVRQNYRG
jgi:hypothetical protein